MILFRTTIISSASLLAWAVLLGTKPARADDVAALRAPAHAWHDGERRGGYLWGGVGLASVGAALSLHRFGHGSDIERGMAYPLGAFGLVQTGIGIGSLLRSNARLDDLDARIARSPEEARRSELSRMRTWNSLFLGVKIVETAVLLGGAAFAATRRGERQELARGIGLGLAMQGGLMLFLDSVAASRAATYTGALESLSFTPPTTTTGGQWLSYRGSFLRGANPQSFELTAQNPPTHLSALPAPAQQSAVVTHFSSSFAHVPAPSAQTCLPDASGRQYPPQQS